MLSGSGVMKFGGIGVARLNDPVFCRGLDMGPTFVAEGHAAFKDNGIPVAIRGNRCACGCLLISSMPQANAR
ncbi:PAAR domain-containing protein [Pseudomonas quasicaspiana]|uniref:PAAR domain-containing protein n=1 Tax=Pseudomonas quasicaspiana TaxID=2829821 RepID=UPI001E6302C2|nr:PAAR domain-containing protein [Pseudomonas quasicaspiana]